MSQKIYVFSTLTSAVNYNIFRETGGDIPAVAATVTVNGGANVADKRIETPRGVVTIIDAEDFAALEQNPIFKLHRENGFITVSEGEGDPEKVAADMTTRDASAPLTDGDFVIEDEESPVPSTLKDGKKIGGRK